MDKPRLLTKEEVDKIKGDLCEADVVCVDCHEVVMPLIYSLEETQRLARRLVYTILERDIWTELCWRDDLAAKATALRAVLPKEVNEDERTRCSER